MSIQKLIKDSLMRPPFKVRTRELQDFVERVGQSLIKVSILTGIGFKLRIEPWRVRLIRKMLKEKG